MSSQINAVVYSNSETCSYNDIHLPSQQRIGFLYHRLISLVDNSVLIEMGEVEKNSRVYADYGSQLKEIAKLLKILGVSKADRKAQAFFIQFFYELKKDKIELIPSSETEGMFFLTVDGKNKYVFKPGEKRAYIETLARKVALAANLEKHIPEGLYCSLRMPSVQMAADPWNAASFDFAKQEDLQTQSSDTDSVEESEEDEEDYSSDDSWDELSEKDATCSNFGEWGLPTYLGASTFDDLDLSVGRDPLARSFRRGSEVSEDEQSLEEMQDPIIIELFNGLVRQIFPDSITGGFLTGILERFVEEDGELVNPAKVADMFILMAMIGLRDTCADNIKGKEGIYIDAEDSFPLPENMAQLDDVALFQLNFLVRGAEESPVIHKPVNVLDLAFKKDVSPTVLMSIMQEKILFFDAVAEKELQAVLVCETTQEEEKVQIEILEDGRIVFKSENRKEKFQEIINQMTSGNLQMLPEGWHFKMVGKDAGGNKVIIEIPCKHAISGYFSYLKKQTFLPAMPVRVIDSVIDRTTRIKQFINFEKLIIPIDILKQVDPCFNWQLEASSDHFEKRLTLEDFEKIMPDAQRAREAYQAYLRLQNTTPLSFIGSQSPRKLGLISPPPNLISIDRRSGIVEEGGNSSMAVGRKREMSAPVISK